MENLKGLIDLWKIALNLILNRVSDCGLQFADSLMVLVAVLGECSNKPPDLTLEGPCIIFCDIYICIYKYIHIPTRYTMYLHSLSVY